MTAPPPMTPPEADLQDFPFMPLHVARLRDSDLAAEEEPEACWYAVLLWAAAWHQLPAGSLPDNDTVLCKLIGLGRDLKTFRKHRAGMMRGFVKCSDGRFYHPVVAEQACEAWRSKLGQRHRTLCAAIRKHNERNPQDKRDAPTFDQWLSLECPANITELVTAMSHVTPPKNECDNGSKRQGQGQGQGLIEEGSDPDGSGATAPLVDPCKIMFDAGLALFAEHGVEPAKARPQIGKWKSEYGTEAVIAALGSAKREGAIHLPSFVKSALEARNGHAAKPNLRGSRPDPVLDAWRAAQAEERAERDQDDGSGTWSSLPAIGAGGS